MAGRLFLRAEEVAQELGISLSCAYKLIKQLNVELEGRGFITINGRVSRQYFMEKVYGNGAGIAKEAQDECL